MSSRILVVDDDRFLQANLRKLLQREGYSVVTASTGEEALDLVAREKPDLIILDLGLPGADGVTICRRLRGRNTLPVIILTARSDAIDKVVGLEVGADDYLTKPFDPAELIARVRAQLRRNNEYRAPEAAQEEELEVGAMTIDFGRRDAVLDDKPAGLTAREFELLAHLARNRGRTVSREALFEAVWGFDPEFSSNSLDVYIYRVRQKIEADPNKPTYLQTVRGYGYRLEAAQDS
jgi:DNA-binding response OmpR family regulator